MLIIFLCFYIRMQAPGGFSYPACTTYCLLQVLIALVDRKTGKKQQSRPRFIKQDQVAIARLQTTGVVCIEKFADFPQMGRFTLRDEGTSIFKRVRSVDLLIAFFQIYRDAVFKVHLTRRTLFKDSSSDLPFYSAFPSPHQTFNP